jgi:hypothetical protein
MSVAIGNQHRETPLRPRRVRQEARDALAVVAFSAGASCALALAILLVVTLVG